MESTESSNEDRYYEHAAGIPPKDDDAPAQPADELTHYVQPPKIYSRDVYDVVFSQVGGVNETPDQVRTALAEVLPEGHVVRSQRRVDVYRVRAEVEVPVTDDVCWEARSIRVDLTDRINAQAAYIAGLEERIAKLEGKRAAD